jgi:uncharacterized protein YbjT (DUF2867 family)
VRTALTGVPVVLMVSASEHSDRVAQHRTFVDTAVAAGVQHLVYISFYGAAPDATFTFARDHHETEQLTTALGRPVRYEPETLEQAYASHAGYGAPDWMVDGWVTTYPAIGRHFAVLTVGPQGAAYRGPSSLAVTL